jgi:hypothetical protein
MVTLLPFAVDKRVVLQRHDQGYAAATRASTSCCTQHIGYDDHDGMAIPLVTLRKHYPVSTHGTFHTEACRVARK